MQLEKLKKWCKFLNQRTVGQFIRVKKGEYYRLKGWVVEHDMVYCKGQEIVPKWVTIGHDVVHIENDWGFGYAYRLGDKLFINGKEIRELF